MMNLNSQQREQIRASIVRELTGAKYGLTEGLLLPLIQNSGFSRLESDQLRAELEWMEERDLVKRTANRFSAANSLWRLTEGGNE